MSRFRSSLDSSPLNNSECWVMYEDAEEGFALFINGWWMCARTGYHNIVAWKYCNNSDNQ